jgi:hypothetical protein
MKLDLQFEFLLKFKMISQIFLKTVVLKPRDLVKSVPQIIMDKLNRYVNTCIQGYLIKEIVGIKACGDPRFATNFYDGRLNVDVQFEAKCRLFEKNKLFLFNITNIDNERLFDKDEEKNTSTQIFTKDKPLVGNCFIAIAVKLLQPVGMLPSILSLPFVKFSIISVTQVLNIHEAELDVAIAECVKNITHIQTEIRKQPFYKQISDIMFRCKSESNLVFEKHELGISPKHKYDDREIYFVVHYGHKYEHGIFYLTHDISSLKAVNEKKKPISVTAMVLEYMDSVHNYISVLHRLCEKFPNKKEFDDNRTIWKHHEIIENNK